MDEAAPSVAAAAVEAEAEAADAADATLASPVLRAKILLDRANFPAGEIDGRGGAKLALALTAFQNARQLPATGALDAATVAELELDTAPLLVHYTVSAADAAGPYRPVPAGMAAKARRRALGYASAAEALGERFHASPSLLRALNPGRRLDRAGAAIVVPNVAPAAVLPAAARIVVDRSDGTLTLQDEHGATFAQFPVTMGGPRDPLPLGTWSVTAIAHDPSYRYNPRLFWDAGPNDRPATLPPGPNNPVGVVWIALSKRHLGIHGTAQPGKIGRTKSHGCIRLSNWDARRVAQAAAVGLPVVFQK
ncbi:L,D-transpeptidase family protein [Massilia glaciei]|uniref:L,D-transpeptidase family protein n=1 Tax=Massilia glaciei TaxID=1524097 RepID=UPI001E37D4F8|nr:L,D-transpeptidase [Massilia glaciei]